MFELANASYGLKFGQLLRGGAVIAKKDMDRMMTGRGHQKVVVVATGGKNTEEERSWAQMYEYIGRKCML